MQERPKCVPRTARSWADTIKKDAAVQCGSAASVRLLEVWVECKEDLNVSRALLFLERIILRRKAGHHRTVW